MALHEVQWLSILSTLMKFQIPYGEFHQLSDCQLVKRSLCNTAIVYFKSFQAVCVDNRAKRQEHCFITQVNEVNSTY
jgi:hypothetical protein